MSGGDYRVRLAVFTGRGAVYHPAGRDGGDKKHGHPIHPPPPFTPPREQSWTVPSLAAARDLARDLKVQHGDNAAIHIEPAKRPAAAPRPRQTSLLPLWEKPTGGEHG